MSQRKLSIFQLYQSFWDWAFDNPEIIKPHMAAIYSFAIQRCNLLGWKEKFGLPTREAMEATGIKSYDSYKTHLGSLVQYGFIEMISRSKNQYSSNVIRLIQRQSETKPLGYAVRTIPNIETPIVKILDPIKTISDNVDPADIPDLPAFGQIRNEYESRGLLWDDDTGRHCHRLISRIKHRIANDKKSHASQISDRDVVEMYGRIVRDGGWWVENKFSMKTLDLRFSEITHSMSTTRTAPNPDRYSTIKTTTFS